MQEISRELLEIMARRASMETGIFPRLTDKGIVYHVQVGVAHRENGKQHIKNYYATCNTLEEAREKRAEFQQFQMRKGMNTKIERLKKRIAALEEELAQAKANA